MAKTAGSSISHIITARVTRDYQEGDIYAEGSLVGVCVSTGRSGENVGVALSGIIVFQKENAQTLFNIGDPVHGDDNQPNVSEEVDRPFVGYAVKPSERGDERVEVILEQSAPGGGGSGGGGSGAVRWGQVTGKPPFAPANAEQNVQADWTQSNSSDDSFIRNKPLLAPSNAEQNVQSDWNESRSGNDAFIKNKPAIPPNLPSYNQAVTNFLGSRAGRLFWERINEVPIAGNTGSVLTKTGSGDEDYAFRAIPSGGGGGGGTGSGLDRSAVLNLIADWAEQGNNDNVPASKIGLEPGSGLVRTGSGNLSTSPSLVSVGNQAETNRSGVETNTNEISTLKSTDQTILGMVRSLSVTVNQPDPVIHPFYFVDQAITSGTRDYTISFASTLLNPRPARINVNFGGTTKAITPVADRETYIISLNVTEVRNLSSNHSPNDTIGVGIEILDSSNQSTYSKTFYIPVVAHPLGGGLAFRQLANQAAYTAITTKDPNTLYYWS